MPFHIIASYTVARFVQIMPERLEMDMEGERRPYRGNISGRKLFANILCGVVIFVSADQS